MSAILDPPNATDNSERTSPEMSWRWSLDQYHAMIDCGILKSGDPVEFLEGQVVLKMTRNPPHRIALAHLRDRLVKLVDSNWHVESQEAISLETSEPEPDIAIVQGQVDDYPDRHPGPNDIGLVAEVSDSTLSTDRDVKKRIYARAGIPVYWILNLVDHQVELYSEPTGPIDNPDYQQRRVFTRGQSVPVIVRGIEIGNVTVTDILPA